MYQRSLVDDKLEVIRFSESLTEKVQALKKIKENKELKLKIRDKFCYDFIKHADYLRNQFQDLASAIKTTRKIFNTSKHVKQEEALPFNEFTEIQAFQTYCKFTNLEFDRKVRGFDDPQLVLDENWLIEQIFVQDQKYNKQEIICFIDMLECTRLKQNLWTYSYSKDNEDKDYLWTYRYNDITNEELPGLYFYMSLVWSSIIVSKNDKYQTSDRIIQQWRIEAKHYFALEFVECISQNQEMGKYLHGRILPIRFPTLSTVPSVSTNSIEEKVELKSFSYTQFIQLESIKILALKMKKKHENKLEIIIEKLIQDNPDHLEQRIKQARDEFWQKYHHNRLNQTWKNISTTNDDPSGYLYQVFQRTVVNYEDAFVNNVIGTLRECVDTADHSGQYLKSFWVSTNRMSCVKWIGKDTSEYKFNVKQWCLPTPEVITMISAYQNHNIISSEENNQIKKELSNTKYSEKLLQIIKQIPNLQIQLSPLQEAVVQSPVNLLCLGRSGTGKTTSSVLRLFSQEIMYTLLHKNQKLKKLKLAPEVLKQQLKLTSQDLIKPVNMKTVFISASPVLVNEVSRFYKNLKNALIAHLIKKENNKNSDTTASNQDDQIKSQHNEMMQLAQLEADLIEEELASKSQFEIPNAFEDLRPGNYPLFVTVKQLLYMLDASLDYSFFARDSKNNLIGMSSNLSWHNENKGLFMINQEHKSQTDFDQLILKYGEELLEDFAELVEGTGEEIDQSTNQQPYYQKAWNNRYKSNPNDKTAYLHYKGQQLSFEIDFEIFEERFYKRFTQNSGKQFKRLSAALVWTEIFSVIKGGLNSADQYNGFLNAKRYINEFASPFLSVKERQTIYYIFLEYESWKNKEKAFDLMDLVQHVLTSRKATSSYYTFAMRMDYLMVDEVQDLAPKALQLLLNLTTQKVYFAGDTAQTIQKGVGARFSDLTTLLKGFGSQVIQLTTNYRSHGLILDLANSVVSLLETLFPQSIDQLAKEISETTGMKPLILMPMPPHLLRKFFLGNKKAYQNVTIGHSVHKPQFGCNQVVIVRDQSQKEQLPEFLQGMLCLTVFESKGLEFDDVILYNFFNSQEINHSHWKFINDVEFNEYDEDTNKYQIVKGLENLIVEEVQFVSKRYQKKNMVNKSIKSSSYVYRKHSSLCIELKYLYVALTRAKKRLIIYDDDAQARLPIQKIWDFLQVTNVVTTTMLEQKQLSEELQVLFETENGCLSGVESSAQEWKIQGIKFYKKKQFDQAIKCFRYAGENELVSKCIAYQMADQGNSKIAEAGNIMWRLKTLNSSKKDKSERNNLKKQITQLRTEARKEFEVAGNNFNTAGLKSQAASCYFSSRRFLKAAELFEELGQFGQAGECLMQSSRVDSQGVLRAAEMFERANLISRAIECYERIQAWERLLICLHQTKSQFKKQERDRLANIYVPIALNKLYLLMIGEEKVNEANQGVLAEIKIKEKYTKKQDEIQEEDEEEYFSEEDESDHKQPEEPFIDVNLTQNVQEQLPEPVKVIQGSITMEELIGDGESYDEDEYEILEDVFELKKKKSSLPLLEKVDSTNSVPKEENSYEVIDDESPEEIQILESKNLLEYQSDFEHLSQYDPDDEFLQSSSSYQLLESILQSKNHDQSSEYSIIDASDDQQSYGVISFDSSVIKSTGSRSVRFLKQQKKIADEVIRKILYYISLFSEEVYKELQKSEFVKEDQIDLNKVSQELIDCVLKVLEQYDLIKLCLILCNKFKFTDKLGRYIVSSCFKYQSLQQVRFTQHIDSYKLESIQQTKLRQQGLIAHEAIHNVFQLVDPTYLRLKNYMQECTHTNSLGIDNFRLIFALGFWKKLVYIMSLDHSIDLCFKFNDLENFKILQDQLSLEQFESEIHQNQRQMIELKAVNQILSKHLSNQKKVGNLYRDKIEKIKEELQLQQLHDKLYVQDFVDLVIYICLPEQRIHQTEVININLINSEKEQAAKLAKQQKDEQFRNQIIKQGVKTIDHLFNKIENNMVQAFFAYCLMSYQITAQKLEGISDNAIDTILQIFQRDYKTSTINKDALYSSLNLCRLDDVKDSLYSQYEKSHVLVSVKSQIIEELAKLQHKFIINIVDAEYLMQGIRICKTNFRKINKQQQINKLKKNLDINPREVDLKSISEPAQSDSAFMIDMDLQYLLVPIDWVSQIILNSQQATLNQLQNASTKRQLYFVDKDKDSLKQWSTIVNNCLITQDTMINVNLRGSFDTNKNLIQEMKNTLTGSEWKILFNKQIQQPVVKKVANKEVVEKSNRILAYRKIFYDIEKYQLPSFQLYYPFGDFDKQEKQVIFCFFNTYQIKDKQIATQFSRLGSEFLLNSDKIHPWIDPTKEMKIEFRISVYTKALQLFWLADQLPLFIDEISQGLNKNQKEDMHLRIGLRLQAYAMISQKHGMIQDAINRYLLSYNFVSPYHSIVENNINMLSQCFYALLPMMQPQLILPFYALGYIDPNVKLDERIREAQDIDYEYNEEQEQEPEFNSEDEGYDEWDRPTIEQAKQIQFQKRESQQSSKTKSLLTHVVTLNIADKVKAVLQIKNILQKLLVILRDMTAGDINENSQVYYSIFNIVQTLCVNFNNLSSYSSVIQQIYTEFDKSFMSDKFRELLFQFTENPSDVKQMFNDTDDYLKYSFFGMGCYLVNLKVTHVQQKIVKNYDLYVDTWLMKRVKARLFIKKQLNKMQITRNLNRYQLQKYQISPKILKINQVLPNLHLVLKKFQQLDDRISKLQLYCIASKQQIACSEIQLLLQNHRNYESLRRDLIKDFNMFIEQKWQILSEFDDMGDIDHQLIDAVDRVNSKMEICDGELIMQSILLSARKNLKEDDTIKTKRISVKWKAWEDLAKRKMRLKNRISKMQQQM